MVQYMAALEIRSMRNITQDLKNAIGVDLPWSVDQFYVFIERIQLLKFKVSYWEGEENWATVSSINDDLLGYVWQKYPLTLFKSKGVNLLEELRNDFEYLVIVIADDLSSKEFIVSEDVMLTDRLDCIEYGTPLSATDIWFSSVN